MKRSRGPLPTVCTCATSTTRIIQDAAQEAGVSTDTVSEAEHTPSLMTRILESLAKSPSLPMAGWADPVPLTASPLFTSTDYRKFVEEVIGDLAAQGGCVIGHAAQVILGAGSIRYECWSPVPRNSGPGGSSPAWASMKRPR